MADEPSPLPPRPGAANPQAEDVATALLADLRALADYLRQRGAKTYLLAQRFAENAQRHPESRAYDERQATMLEYQHYIWQEIAGLVTKLAQTYDASEDGAAPAEPDAP